MRQYFWAIGFGVFATMAQAQSHDPKEQRAGDEAHPKILAQMGGAYDDVRLTAYVERIGRSLVRHSRLPNAKWTFTVIDSPVVNAFALPGGYIYVTRGLLALANSEAELAGVLGHEIGHVTSRHFAERKERAGKANAGLIAGAVIGGLLGGKDGARDVLKTGSQIAKGYLAGHSREHEFEADRVGVNLLLKAGYDPHAQADFLDSMGDQQGLAAALAGKSYDPNTVTFFASHPATAKRVREAIKLAGGGSGRRFEGRYLAAIDGMIYGDSPKEGFVRARGFAHPNLRFAFDVPDGFSITNSANNVTARGPEGAVMVFDLGTKEAIRPDRYIRDVWVGKIAKYYEVGKLQQLKRVRINGLDGAQAVLPIQTKNGRRTAVLTTVAYNNRIYRLQGVAPPGAKSVLRSLSAASRSFRPLSEWEAAQLRPYRISTYEVSRGDSINLLAATIPMQRERERRFRVLNNYDDGRNLLAGDVVKMITE